MGLWQVALQRETAAHVIAGGRSCPTYGLPEWVCSVLHLVTGLCRTVTTGRFDRFGGHFDTARGGPSNSDDGGIYRPWIAEFPCCPHHLEAQGLTYWSTPQASTLDPAEQAEIGGP